MNAYGAALVQQWSGKIPQDSQMMLTQRLEKLDDDKVAAVGIVALKNPVVGLVLGLFFGGLGVDRFYKGDIGLGLLKLFGLMFIWILVFMFGGAAIMLGAAAGDDDGAAVGAAFGILLSFGAWLITIVWCILDLFFVWKGIKKDNLNKINNQLMMCGA